MTTAAGSTEPSLRRIELSDWQLLRSLRLAALSTDPSAFGSTYEREVAFADDEWRARAGAAAVGSGSCYLFAERSGEVVGLIGAWWPGEAAFPEMVSMWVRPEARGSGVARRLVDGLIAWARDVDAAGIGLYVTVGNGPAERLYCSAGFVDWPDESGESVHPCSGERRMLLRLG